ncbi:hypothetical protein NLI96_g13102 [Meripilus lineatus]|uniref:Uncharacterized protein n=1 Tax=Meripilus lineatus TaxID=2056292 RepID=A0AAD5UNL6_9APHY|nr:hypothetical protein NLI96_g13102 [Physisporinus lineatus]
MKDSLLPHDIVDLGPSPPKGWKRYVLKPLVWENIESVVIAVQNILNRMIAILPDKPEGYLGYRIDRVGDVMEALQTSQDVVLLCSAWTIIRVRLRRGVRFIEKYRQLGMSEEISSPITTDRSIYEKFEPDADPSTRFKEYYARVPSMNEGKEIDDSHAEEVMGKELEEIILVDRRNKEAFPEHLEPSQSVPFSYREGFKERVSAEHVLKRLTGPPSVLVAETQERQSRRSPSRSNMMSSHSEREVDNSLLMGHPATRPALSSTSTQTAIPRFKPPIDFFKNAPGASTQPTIPIRSISRQDNLIFGLANPSVNMGNRDVSQDESTLFSVSHRPYEGDPSTPARSSRPRNYNDLSLSGRTLPTIEEYGPPPAPYTKKTRKSGITQCSSRWPRRPTATHGR